MKALRAARSRCEDQSDIKVKFKESPSLYENLRVDDDIYNARKKGSFDPEFSPK